MLRELRHLSPHANAQLRLLVAGLVGEAVLAGIALSLTLPFLKNFIYSCAYCLIQSIYNFFV